MRSERARTWSMSCSISTIVTDRRSVRIRSATRSRSWAARPASGSSSSNSSGRVASAMAISSSRWSPCERLSAISKARSPRPTASTSRSASVFRSVKLPESASIAKRQRRLAWAAMRTFSKTVSAWKMLMIWNERETPDATIWCGRSAVIVVARNRAWPRSAGRRPVRTLKSVVLPAPFGPMIERSSPRGTRSDTPSTAASAPKCLARSWASSSTSPAGPAAPAAGTSAGAAAGAARVEDPPEGRVDDAPEDVDGEGGEDRACVVVDAFVAEVEPEGADAQGEALDSAEAVFAPRHRRRPVDDVEEHLRERERQEREVDAALAHQEEADHRPGERGARDAGDEGDDHALRQVELGEPRRVAADPEEGRVAEGDEPRVPHQQVVGDGGPPAEDEREHRPQADAEEPHHHRIAAAGADDRADRRLLEKQRERHDEEDHREQDEAPVLGVGERTELERAGEGGRHVERLGAAPPDQADPLLEDHREPEGEQEPLERVLKVEAAQERRLDEHAQDADEHR